MTSEQRTPILKVLFVVRALDVGGAERQLIVLANGLAARGHRVTVCTAYPGGVLAGELDSRVARHDLGQRSRRDYPRLLPRLRRLIGMLRPDVVHGYLPTSNVLVSLASWRLFPAVVWGIRASDMDLSHYDVAHRAGFALGRTLASHAELIISNSHAGVAYHAERGYPPERMAVVANGIDGERFRPGTTRRVAQRREWNTGDRPVVGIVGRLDPMKDHTTFLHAIRRVRDAGIDALFICIGAGPPVYAAHLRALGASLGVGDAIRWLPPASDIADAYPAFDLLVSSSAFGEGFSNVLGEALASGVPCIGTDVGDARIVLGDEETVVPPRDSAALADAIVTRLRHGDSCEQRAARRARVLRDFGLDRMIDRTQELLMPFAGRGAAG